MHVCSMHACMHKFLNRHVLNFYSYQGSVSACSYALMVISPRYRSVQWSRDSNDSVFKAYVAKHYNTCVVYWLSKVRWKSSWSAFGRRVAVKTLESTWLIVSIWSISICAFTLDVTHRRTVINTKPNGQIGVITIRKCVDRFWQRFRRLVTRSD
jgi:hypothetical protein